jgi:hypothetical protein
MDVKTGEDIPFEDLAGKLFDDSPDQKLIPFLGAGVPLSDAPAKPDPEIPGLFPNREKIDEALAVLGLPDGPPRQFATFALVTACLMSAAHSREQRVSAKAQLDALTNRDHPPSSAELTALISDLAQYSPLKEPAAALRKRVPAVLVEETDAGEFTQILQRLLETTGLPSGDSLTSVAGYFETQSGRQRLWEVLARIFQRKAVPTPTHRLLADAAFAYLSPVKRRVVKDYLIVTTNYDGLLETALAQVNVPYAVLSLYKKDGKIHVRAAKGLEELELDKSNPPCYPNQFLLSRREPLVVVYKIHGCLARERPNAADSVIISDNDYVDYISRMSTNEGVIPVHVGTLMRDKPFLFLGYSLKDWNVRSVFETMVRKRGSSDGVRDYLVTKSYTPFDEAYYTKHNIQVLKSELNAFVKGIRAQVVPEGATSDGQLV